MKTWAAPLITVIISTLAAIAVAEPLVAYFGIIIAALGYLLNKAEDK